VVRPQFNIEKVWAEGKNKSSDQGKRVTSILDWYDLREPVCVQLAILHFNELLNIPGKSSQFTNSSSNSRKGHAHYHLAEVVACGNENTTNANACRSEESDVALTE
jgi:hypothetical protein